MTTRSWKRSSGRGSGSDRSPTVARLAAGAGQTYNGVKPRYCEGTMSKEKKEKSEKSQIVAFKVDADLADFLDRLSNKSEFIRRAILAQFSMTCPLCTG